MPNIGQNFPLTRAARKNALQTIKTEGRVISTVKVPGYGYQNVYRIPLEKLCYNPYNTRFFAQAKTLEKRLGRKLDDENADDVKAIEEFIWNEKKDKNDNTIDSLVRDGQLQPGVVTISGVILSGNRRFRLLNHIVRHPNQYRNHDISGLQFFEAAILDNTDISEKEIVRLESFFQYGTEDKVGYSPIQKYIAASYQKRQLNFDSTEIAANYMALTDGKAKVVDEWIEVFDLMEEYLDYIGEPGIYTALETREEAFLNLKSTIKSYTTGKAAARIWAFDEMDLDDLKLRYFDFIRLNIATHDFRDFKKIFSDEQRWKTFNHKVDDAITDNDVDDFQAYRERFPDMTEEDISKMRNTDYVVKNKVILNKLYGEEKGAIINRETEETPLNIVKQIQQKLTKLEAEMASGAESEVYESEEFFQAIKDIQKRIGSIKQKID